MKFIDEIFYCLPVGRLRLESAGCDGECGTQCRTVIVSCGTVPDSGSECGKCQTVMRKRGTVLDSDNKRGTVLDSTNERDVDTMAL